MNRFLIIILAASSFSTIDTAPTIIGDFEKMTQAIEDLKLGVEQIKKQYDNYRLYKAQYKKPEEANVDLEYLRFTTYVKNVEKIRAHNERYELGKETYKMGINQFTDMLPEELDKMNGFRPDLKRMPRATNSKSFKSANGKLPKSIDWREKGAVTPVKYQGNCGSCWAFSSTGSLEGQHFLKTGKLVSLSEQNLMDCSWDYGNQGCDGGFMSNAFEYVIDNSGIDTEESYPYEEETSYDCRYKNKTRGTTATDYVRLPWGDEKVLKEAVATVGPISAAMDVTKSLYHYGEGIYKSEDCAPNQLNHGILVVGYGSKEVKLEGNRTEVQDYWIVKNSWGTWWGMEGYFLIARNAGNMCGIADVGLYPVVPKSSQ